MKYFVTILFALLLASCSSEPIRFHTRDGGELWIVQEHIVAVIRSTDSDDQATNAKIDASNGKTYYVQETPKQILEKLK